MTIKAPLLVILTGFGFLAASAFNFLDRSSHMKVGPSVLEGMLDGAGMLWAHLGFFLIVFTLLHATTGWIAGWVLEPIARRISRWSPEKLVLLLVLAGILWLTLQNAAIFPHSMLGSSFHDFADSTLGSVLRWAVGLSVGTALVAGMLLRARAAMQPSEKTIGHALWGIPVIAAIIFTSGWLVVGQQKPFPTQSNKPHVILIGIDGWRLESFRIRARLREVMPFVARFAEKSASVEEAVTPLARTYPAWWTIFSGQFPPRTGVRFNLIADQYITTPLQLPEQLGRHGYHRMLAMDERRFANFRPEQGFDEIIGPASGAADFLIAGLHDTPLVNLLVNGAIGRHLFPFLHGNRAAYHTYKPESFDALLAGAIANAPRKPLFLATHFELPHWPFIWAVEPTYKFLDMAGDRELARYYEALEAADRQIENLFAELDSHGILENAVVVLLSDHGEALPIDDRAWARSESKNSMTTSVGHGTHVLGLHEYRIPMLFRGYGVQHIPPGRIKGRASLADVYPTVADWMGMEPAEQPDGISLFGYMNDAGSAIPERSLPIETGFNPDVLSTDKIQPDALLAKGIVHYTIGRDGNLSLKTRSIDQLLQQKRRGVIRGRQILTPAGLDPETGKETWLLADIDQRELRNIAFPSPGESGIDDMRRDFCRIFSGDAEVQTGTNCNRPEQARNAAD